MRRFLIALAGLWSKLYSPRIAGRVDGLRNDMYSRWIRSAFGSMGEHSRIRRPLYLYGGENIFVGDNFCAFRGLRIETFTEHNGESFSPRLTIGDNVSMNFDCHIGCVERIDIGNNVLLASRVFITDHFHGTTRSRSALEVPPSDRILATKGPVVIEDDVWLGEGVCVMPGVRIGRGAIVGSNAVVTRDIPSYAVAGGIPAKVIKQL